MSYARFRINRWDYMLLAGQIISMQFSIYSVLGILLILARVLFNANYSLSSLFEYNVIRLSGYEGRMIICVFVINSTVAALLLWGIVKRTKQCLDFSCTFHGFHLLVCWCYNSSFPSNLSWWLLNVITSALMCITGEFLCLKSELNKIPVGYCSLDEKSDV